VSYEYIVKDATRRRGLLRGGPGAAGDGLAGAAADGLRGEQVQHDLHVRVSRIQGE